MRHWTYWVQGTTQKHHFYKIWGQFGSDQGFYFSLFACEGGMGKLLEPGPWYFAANCWVQEMAQLHEEQVLSIPLCISTICLLNSGLRKAYPT